MLYPACRAWRLAGDRGQSMFVEGVRQPALITEELGGEWDLGEGEDLETPPRRGSGETPRHLRGNVTRGSTSTSAGKDKFCPLHAVTWALPPSSHSQTSYEPDRRP